MRTLVALLLFSATLAAQAPPAPPPPQTNATAAETRRLLDLMGASTMVTRLIEGAVDRQMATFTKLRPDIPPEFWSEFAAETRKQIHPDELVDLMVPIYEKHFTAEEIRQLITFYESPVGRKIIGKLPQIQEEAMQVGRQWGEQFGRRIGAEVGRKLTEKGYKLGTPPKAPEKD